MTRVVLMLALAGCDLADLSQHSGHCHDTVTVRWTSPQVGRYTVRVVAGDEWTVTADCPMAYELTRCDASSVTVIGLQAPLAVDVALSGAASQRVSLDELRGLESSGCVAREGWMR